MFLTLTPNPALDKFYIVEGFQAQGGVHRLPPHVSVAGGKGINSARALARLGETVVAAGVLGGHVGQEVQALLEEAGINTAFVPVDGTTRICTTVTSPDAQVHFEFLEQGPPVTDGEWQQLASLRPQATWPQLRGVVVAGNPETFARPACLADVLQQWHLTNVPVLMDVRAPWLLEALPWVDVVKINAQEWQDAGFGGSDHMVPTAQRLLQEHHLQAVMISDGAQPLTAVTPAGVFAVRPPAITVVSAVGCGDTMNAGLIRGLAAGHDWERILVDAVALAAANACSMGAAVFDVDLAVSLQDDVVLQRIL